MNYDELEAGPELDRLVAERVMGHDVFSIGGEGLQEARGTETRNLARYSTDIAAAWEVVDHLWLSISKTGYGIYRFSINRHDDKAEGWSAMFAMDPQGDVSTHSQGHAPTAPLAICRAALLAVTTRAATHP